MPEAWRERVFFRWESKALARFQSSILLVCLGPGEQWGFSCKSPMKVPHSWHRRFGSTMGRLGGEMVSPPNRGGRCVPFTSLRGEAAEC